MKAKQKQPTTIDEYIADFPEDAQEIWRKVFRAKAPRRQRKAV